MIHTSFVPALLANTQLNNIINSEIHPVVSKTELENFIVYNQIGSEPEYCTSGLVSDTVTYSFISISKSYDTANLIAKLIRQTIDLQYFSTSNTEVYEAQYAQFVSSEYDPELQCYIINESYIFHCDYNT